MTLGFLQTAPLTAKPRLSAIAEPNKPAPQYASFEDAMRAMKADAKKIQQKGLKLNPKTKPPREPLSEVDVYEYIKENPGMNTNKIAGRFNRQVKSVVSLLSRMEERGSIRSTSRIDPETKRNSRCFTVVAENEPSRDRRTATQKVYAQIKKSPGSTKIELAEAMGLTVNQIDSAVGNMRRYKDRYPLKKVYENGVRSTCRFWVGK